jgi:hypothetical protein
MSSAALRLPQSVLNEAQSAATSVLFGSGGNWYTQLNGMKFEEFQYRVGGDGKVALIPDSRKLVTPADMQKGLKEHYTTMSFGFGSCAFFCPLTVPNLAQVSEQVKKEQPAAKLTHVVIGVFGSAMDNESLANQIVERSGGSLKPGENVRIIFPLDPKGQSIYPDSVTEMAAIYDKLGIIANRGSAGEAQPNQNHPAIVTLYKPNGDKMTQALGTKAGTMDDFACRIAADAKGGAHNKECRSR